MRFDYRHQICRSINASAIIHFLFIHFKLRLKKHYFIQHLIICFIHRAGLLGSDESRFSRKKTRRSILSNKDAYYPKKNLDRIDKNIKNRIPLYPSYGF